MNKIVKHLTTGLLLTFTLQGTVLATELTPNTPSPQKDTEIHIQKLKPTFHYVHAASKILENKYGVTAADIEKAEKDGKTFFDLAKSKGLSDADFRNAIISPKLKAIEDAIATGELTKEKAEQRKTEAKENIQKWDGKIVDVKDRCNNKEHRKGTCDNKADKNIDTANEQ
jgi:hypothetical protein